MSGAMTRPAISVVMSVYNGEEYLAEAVESILAQTFGDFEFIVIDDGSTDGTARMLAEYAARDGRVRVVTQENRGRPAALNLGMEMAQADLIARMDADDVALPERFERQVKFLEAHREVGLLGTGVEHIGPRGQRLGALIAPTEDREIRETMRRWCAFRHPTVMMRKAAALAAGGYRSALRDADDYDLWLRMAERTRMANLPQILLRYRIHPKQVSVSNMAHQMWCWGAATAAASMRREGLRDPLEDGTEITPEFARQLGVRDENVQHDIAAGHYIWIGMLATMCPDEALRLMESLLRMQGQAGVSQRVIADALCVAARIHLRAGRVGSALAAAGHAAAIHPLVAGRVARMAFSRRLRDWNERVLHLVQ